MTLVIGFMTSILFCRTCNDSSKCTGYISCHWLSPHDEANCPQQCPSSRPIPCECNKPGNMACAERVGQRGYVCYDKSCKFFVFCFFCKRHNCCKIKQSKFCFKRLLNCDVKIISLKQFI